MAVESESTAARATFDALRETLERSDIDAVMELFADDATMTTYSERSRPSSAEELRGKEAIGEVWREIERRNLTEKVTDAVVGDDRFAFALLCIYPTGERVFGTYICQLRDDGRIARVTGAEAWDE